MDVVVLVDVDYVGLEVHALEGRHEGSPDDLGPARDAGLPLAHGRRAAAVAAAVRRGGIRGPRFEPVLVHERARCAETRV